MFRFRTCCKHPLRHPCRTEAHERRASSPYASTWFERKNEQRRSSPEASLRTLRRNVRIRRHVWCGRALADVYRTLRRTKAANSEVCPNERRARASDSGLRFRFSSFSPRAVAVDPGIALLRIACAKETLNSTGFGGLGGNLRKKERRKEGRKEVEGDTSRAGKGVRALDPSEVDPRHSVAYRCPCPKLKRFTHTQLEIVKKVGEILR